VTKADFVPYQAPHLAAPASMARSSGTASDLGAICGARGNARDAGIVVLGAGTAGWAAVEALRALDADVPITLITACCGDRYRKPELSLALGLGRSAEQLVHERAEDAATRLRVRLLADTYAVGLSPALHQLRTTRGTLRYTRLILAQGARAALPGSLPPHLCWRVNDLDAWAGVQRALAGGPKRIAIVGAGLVGCELAEDFARAGHTVMVLDVNRWALAALLPESAALRLHASWERLGIRFLGERQVTGVSDHSAQVSGERIVHTQRDEAWHVDLVLSATGLNTEPRLARQAGLRFERGIAVDPHTLQTSAADVYALGDCISIDGQPCRFIEPIAPQAVAIAHAVLGREHEGYRHRPPVLRVKTRSLPIVLRGAPSRELDWTVLDEDDVYMSLAQYSEGHIVASLSVGNQPSRASGTGVVKV
jgi:rubredoxin-NAD+ reductase